MGHVLETMVPMVSMGPHSLQGMTIYIVRDV